MCKKIIQISHLATVSFVLGCSTPLKEHTSSIDLVTQAPAILEEEADTPDLDSTITLPIIRKTSVESSLEHRMEELEALTPANTQNNWDAEIGINLHQETATSAPLEMGVAILFALENNLDIRIATLQPLISTQSMVTAEAAFDFLFGAGASSTRAKIPQQQAIINGVPLNSAESTTDTLDGNLSLVKQLYGGGTLTLSTDVTKTDNKSNGSIFLPDPAWQTVGTIDVAQPLLRNFGETVTLAQIHLSEITHNQSKEELRNTLNEVVTATEHAYLDLSLQWKTLQIKLWLLNKGEEVVEILDIRRSYDASEADFAQAVATVQQRRADVISQQASLQKASDTLKKLMNTEEYSLESEEMIQPAGWLEASPISISLRQAMMTALENRPDLRTLSLSINSNE